MTARAFDLNDEFGVGFLLDPAEDAFPSSEPMPQFLPAAQKTFHNPWPPRLVLDLAYGLEDYDTLCDRHGVTRAALETLFDNPKFRADVLSTAHELHTNGKVFGQKARIIAEQGLERLDRLIHDGDTPLPVVLSAIQSAVKWGGLEPKPEKTADQNNTQAVQININIPNYA